MYDDPGRTDPTIKTLRGDITFQNVTLQYGRTPVLQDINLHVPPATFLGLTGPTGSGKTSSRS
ncbi:hypothetical protein CTI14_48730 [Methylobacterium radiotolerans]|nr:hypothetical protein CTI14_48730 [Methylobacterium radiotolerans]